MKYEIKCERDVMNGGYYILLDEITNDIIVAKKLKMPFKLYGEILELGGAQLCLDEHYLFDDMESCQKTVSVLTKIAPLFQSPFTRMVYCIKGLKLINRRK